MSRGLQNFFTPFYHSCAIPTRKQTINSAVFLSHKSTSSKAAVAPPKKMEELKKNPYFDKYADRLSAVRSQNPEKFLQKAEEIKEKNAISAGQPAPKTTKPAVAVSAKPVYVKQRSLSDIMKLELLQNRPVQEISEIWAAYHKSLAHHIAAVVPAKIYTTMTQHAEKYPIFLYPLPRAGGYEFFVGQFHGRECYFTQLGRYQTHREDAPPSLSVIHFEDFLPEGVVLMRGEFDDKVLNPVEVQCLLNQVQLYYGMGDKEKLGLLEAFNKSPSTFRHDDLIRQIEHSFSPSKG